MNDAKRSELNTKRIAAAGRFHPLNIFRLISHSFDLFPKITMFYKICFYKILKYVKCDDRYFTYGDSP